MNTGAIKKTYVRKDQKTIKPKSTATNGILKTESHFNKLTIREKITCLLTKKPAKEKPKKVRFSECVEIINSSYPVFKTPEKLKTENEQQVKLVKNR